MAQTQNLNSTQEVVIEDLKQTLTKIVKNLFGPDKPIRWDETAYFPFTNPSIELEVLFDEKWVEVLGCGKIRQEILKEAGLNHHEGWFFFEIFF